MTAEQNVGIKKYFQENTAGNLLRIEFLRSIDPGAEPASKHNIQLLTHLLAEMTNAGRDGLFSLKQFQSGGRAAEFDPVDFQRVVEEGRDDLAVILLAATIPTMHETIVTREIDLNPLVARINQAISGTPLLPIFLSDRQKEVTDVSADDWKAMVGEAKANNTYAGFFRNPFLSPFRLRQFLIESGILTYARPAVDKYEAICKDLLIAA